MKIKRIYPLLCLLLILSTSCQKNKVYYQKTTEFEDNYWPRFQHLNYDIPIKNVQIKYDLLLDITYDKYINYTELPIQVNSKSSDGEERFSEFHLKIKNQEGFIGLQQNNGTYVYTHLIRHNISVNEPGVINIDIECFHPKYYIENIKSVGIRLVKATKTDNNKEKLIKAKRKNKTND